MKKTCIILLLLSNSFFATAFKADNKKWKNNKAELKHAKSMIQKLFPQCCQQYHKLMQAEVPENESIEIVIKTNAGKKIVDIERKGLLVAYFFA